MLGLILNVMLDAASRRRADRERRVTFLPEEMPVADFVMHPGRRGFFQFAHHVGKTVRGFESEEQMNMIVYAADNLRNAAQPANRAAKIIVQARLPFRADERLPVFRAEHEMIMQAQIG